MKPGHPADCNSKKETVQAKKERDNKKKSEKKEVIQTLNKKGNDCLFKINYQHPNHRWYIKAETQTRSNV